MLELILYELSIPIITNDHPFAIVRNSTFIADIGYCEGVVSSNHHTFQLSLFQDGDGCFCLGLQLILKDQKAVENKPTLSL